MVMFHFKELKQAHQKNLLTGFTVWNPTGGDSETSPRTVWTYLVANSKSLENNPLAHPTSHSTVE